MTDERTVLVVDDDPAIVEMMRDFLEAEGFRVEGAVSARRRRRRWSGPGGLRAAGHHDAGRERLRALPADAQDERRADPLPQRARRGPGQDSRPRARRRRLHRQVRHAAEVVARVKAVLRRYGGQGAGPRRRAGLRAAGARRAGARGAHRRRAGVPHAARVRDPLPARRAPAPGLHLRAAARALLGRRRRPAHRHRPHRPHAREDRGGPGQPHADRQCLGRRLSLRGEEADENARHPQVDDRGDADLPRLSRAGLHHHGHARPDACCSIRSSAAQHSASALDSAGARASREARRTGATRRGRHRSATRSTRSASAGVLRDPSGAEIFRTGQVDPAGIRRGQASPASRRRSWRAGSSSARSNSSSRSAIDSLGAAGGD